MQAPSWYNSHDAFNVSNFNFFVNHTMLFAQAAMSSRPGSSSGGGSSGGGSSGGGSSGGGGSSW